MQVILYPYQAGVAVVVPSPNCGLTVDQIAHKDVPEGLPFCIVEVPALTADVFELTADFSMPDGIAGRPPGV